MIEKPSDTRNVIYHPPREYFGKLPTSSVDPIGIDSEAYEDGKLMMVTTSDGDVWGPDEWVERIMRFSARQRVYVAYNLRYDGGHFLRHLPEPNLEDLRVNGKTIYEDIKYHVIANKYISISKHKHTITIYDLKQYYEGSLDKVAQKYLGKSKIEMETKSFSYEYVRLHWNEIAKYSVEDCVLVRDLARNLIAKLNEWGLHVTKLYSTAWISYQWFAAKSGHPSVGHFWHNDRRVLDYAMSSYSGGKFEVTKKGADYLYEYDLVSAYPYTISKLLDLHDCSISWGRKYQSESTYAFIRCKGIIPVSLPSPVAVKREGINTFPAGYIDKTITKIEYDYLTSYGADLSIDNAVWIYPNGERYKYKKQIEQLVELKGKYKGNDEMAYHVTKILMNSLYGKFVQLIHMGKDKWRASSSWNPLYASIITAETRTRISDLQRQYPSIWGVHTDSIISDQPLPFKSSKELGALSYETEGPGILVGCGVYQIGDKVAIRGMPLSVSLREIAQRGGKTASFWTRQPLSWRQALLRNHEHMEINKFIEQSKRLRPDMDTKRIWLDDWKDWSEVLTRQVDSVPRGYY